MIRAIPKAALTLGVAGLIPFLATTYAIRFGSPLPLAVPPTDTLLWYSMFIFCFMSGALWGFAAKTDWAVGYLLSVLPVVAFFLAITTGTLDPINALILGFLGLLPLDAYFTRKGCAPSWWLTLRLGLSAVVVACLVAVWRVVT